MAQKCTVCNHIKSAEINAQLVEGATLETLSKSYGVTVAALQRHKKHIPPHLSKAYEAKETAAADSLMGRITDLDGKAQDVYERAINADNLSAAVQAIRELRGITELYAKITGELSAQNVTNIIVAPEWLTLRTAILSALESYPAARQAVIEAVGRVEN